MKTFFKSDAWMLTVALTEAMAWGVAGFGTLALYIWLIA